MIPSRSFVLCFFIINLILSSFYLDTWLNPNTTSRVLQVRSLYESGKISIDKYHEETIDKSLVNGHYYPDKAPLPSFLIYSIYNPLVKIGLLPDPDIDQGKSIFMLGSFITGSLCFALIILLIFNILVGNGHSISQASLLSTLPLYGSMYFVYAGTFYAHIMVSLFVLMTLELIKQDRQYFLAGLFAGAAFFSEYLTAVIFCIFFFQIIYNTSFKKAFLFALGISPFVLAFFVYNYATTGHFLETLYAYQVYYDLENGGFTWPSLVSLIQMLLSPWRGIIFHTTFILLFIPLLSKITRMKVSDWLGNYTAIPIITYFILLSAFTEWPGGWSYGTRYLLPALSILMYLGYSSLKSDEVNKFLLSFSIGLGIIHAFSAKLTIQYSIPSENKFPFIEKLLPSVLSEKFNDNSLLSTLFNVGATQSAFLFLALFCTGILALLYLAKKNELVQ